MKPNFATGENNFHAVEANFAPCDTYYLNCSPAKGSCPKD